MKKFSRLLLITTSVFAVQTVEASNSLKDIFEEGNAYIDARYRYEFVDQDGIAEQAHASTLRTRFGYETANIHNFSATLEFENITQIGSENYNDTINGLTDHPIVADVEDTAISQAFLQYSGIKDTKIRVGREAINYDSQRFIGSVDWRQNNQTFDTISIINESIKNTKIKYGYLEGVNRIFGTDSLSGQWDSNSHIINVSHKNSKIDNITAYGYFLDFEEDAPASSSRTYGVSLSNSHKLGNSGFDFKYHLEYARQNDHGNNTISYDADYIHISPKLRYNGLTVSLGYELLGSDDGNIGFSTPLATLHKFNGWADKFLNTPANGLEDIYLDITYKVYKAKKSFSYLDGLLLKAQYHEFSSDEGNIDYGNEIGLHAQLPILDNYYIQARYANYSSDNFATDTEKLILGFGVKF